MHVASTRPLLGDGRSRKRRAEDKERRRQGEDARSEPGQTQSEQPNARSEFRSPQIRLESPFDEFLMEIWAANPRIVSVSMRDQRFRSFVNIGDGNGDKTASSRCLPFVSCSVASFNCHVNKHFARQLITQEEPVRVLGPDDSRACEMMNRRLMSFLFTCKSAQ